MSCSAVQAQQVRLAKMFQDFDFLISQAFGLGESLKQNNNVYYYMYSENKF